MHEGWCADVYFVLFEPEEVEPAGIRYGVSEALPGFRLVGLHGWDDFLVQDATGVLFRVPAVPLVSKYLEPFTVLPSPEALQPDARFAGRIKWYVTPLVFGGKADLGENVSWVQHEQHSALVRWWNAKYSEVQGVRLDA